MDQGDEILFSVEKVIDILLKAVAQKVRRINTVLAVTEDTLLKADAEMDVYDFGDLLQQLHDKTKWKIDCQHLTTWFTKQDCTIKELAGKTEFAIRYYPRP